MIAHPCTDRFKPDAACRMLRPALRYASNGQPVFPCRTDKKPATCHGFKDASTDREKIIAWWTSTPDAMIGMATGATSGIIAVDLDVDPAEGLDGVAEFNCLTKGDTINTRTHQTPRGGLHLLFQHPGGRIKNSVSAVASGIDIRGDGGYIIMPPSNSATGEYKVKFDYDPMPVPECLDDLFRDHTAGNLSDACLNNSDHSAHRHQPGCPPKTASLIASGAKKGERNETAFFIATQLRDEGLDRATVKQQILSYANNCIPPLSGPEAMKVVASAFSQPPRDPARNPLRPTQPNNDRCSIVKTLSMEAPDPWESPAPLGGISELPPPWPWDAIPPTLRDMGQAIEKTYNVPAEMAGAGVIGVASIALGNKLKIALKPDHKQFGNLYFMVVADVAAGKTPVTRAVQEPIVKWQRTMREIWEQKCNDWKVRKKVMDARIRGLEERIKKQAAKHNDDNHSENESFIKKINDYQKEIGQEPIEPILFCADATSEALAQVSKCPVKRGLI